MPRRNARPRPSTSTSHQVPIEEILQELGMLSTKDETKEESPKLPLFLEYFEKLSPLEYAALEAERQMKEKWIDSPYVPWYDPPKNLGGFSVRTKFRGMEKDVKAEMMKRSSVRRELVRIVYKECGDEQNKIMNYIKDITDKKNSPVEMKEIEYCIRQLRAKKEIDFNTDIDILLKDEKILETEGNYCFTGSVPLQRKATVECLDIRLNPSGLFGFLETKIGRSCWSSLYRSYDPPLTKLHIRNTMLQVKYFLEMCQKNEATVASIKLTIGDYDNSNRSLQEFMDLPTVSKFDFANFELQKKGAKISDSLKACKNINCKNLNITSGTFKGDNAETILEAMRSCREGVQKWSIASMEMIPDEVITKGIDAVDPSFEVTMGYVKQTRQSCIVFEKTDRNSDGSLKPCKWNSYISL